MVEIGIVVYDYWVFVVEFEYDWFECFGVGGCEKLIYVC